MKYYTIVAIFLFGLIHSGCKPKYSDRNQYKVDVFVIVLDSNVLSKMSPVGLVELIKNKSGSIYIIESIPIHFCDSLFINQLEPFLKDNAVSANIIDGTQSRVFRYEKSKVRTEVSKIIQRINFKCPQTH